MSDRAEFIEAAGREAYLVAFGLYGPGRALTWRVKAMNEAGELVAASDYAEHVSRLASAAPPKPTDPPTPAKPNTQPQ